MPSIGAAPFFGLLFVSTIEVSRVLDTLQQYVGRKENVPSRLYQDVCKEACQSPPIVAVRLSDLSHCPSIDRSTEEILAALKLLWKLYSLLSRGYIIMGENKSRRAEFWRGNGDRPAI